MMVMIVGVMLIMNHPRQRECSISWSETSLIRLDIKHLVQYIRITLNILFCRVSLQTHRSWSSPTEASSAQAWQRRSGSGTLFSYLKPVAKKNCLYSLSLVFTSDAGIKHNNIYVCTNLIFELISLRLWIWWKILITNLPAPDILSSLIQMKTSLALIIQISTLKKAERFLQEIPQALRIKAEVKLQEQSREKMLSKRKIAKLMNFWKNWMTVSWWRWKVFDEITQQDLGGINLNALFWIVGWYTMLVMGSLWTSSKLRPTICLTHLWLGILCGTQKGNKALGKQKISRLASILFVSFLFHSVFHEKLYPFILVICVHRAIIIIL